MTSPRAVLAGVALLATAVGLTACAPTAEEPDGPMSLVLGVTGFSVDYNPVGGGGNLYSLNGGGLNMQAVYEGLVVWNQSNDTFEPWLASDWTVAEDRLSMTMTLRDDVTFVDGEPLTAQGVERLFDALRDDPATGWTGDGLLGVYDMKVTATSDHELEFTAVKPIDHILFFAGLSNTAIPSPAALDDLESLAETAVGSGPYIVDEVVPEVSISLVRNEDYWNPDAYPFDELELKVFTDNVAALNALKTGQIDATVLDIPNAGEAESSGFVLHTGSGISRVLWIQDRAGELNPAFADVRVRQAMNLAFDREAILENLDLGYGYVSSQVFTKGQPGYLEGRDDEYPYDPERAKELLAEAGYADGFDLTIPTTAYLAAFDPIVQQSLGDIGIRVTFETMEIVDFINTSKSGDYPVTMWAESFASMDSGFIDPDAFWNGSGYEDPIVTDLIHVVGEVGTETGVEAAQELGEYLLEQAWLVPFSRPFTVWGSIPEVDVQLTSFIYKDQLIWFQRAE